MYCYNSASYNFFLTLTVQIRIQSYSTTPVEKLNEDQLRTLKTLPVLEGIHKELEEVKKAVEVGLFHDVS